MKERPILFSAPMVRAILEGRKVQTRRVVKARHFPKLERFLGGTFDGKWNLIPLPYGQPGDRLWVRETHSIGPGPDVPLLPGETGGALAFPHVTYAADGVVKSLNLRWQGAFGRKRPSIHMPRWASRITLEIIDVRVQRLQEISADDAIAEGVQYERPIDPRDAFRSLWWSINGAASWDVNPWVWALTFQQVAP